MLAFEDILNSKIWESKVWEWAKYILLGILLALILNYGLSLILSTTMPVVTVKTGSMEPALSPGDIVFIRGREVYEPGDVIVFTGWMETPIIHRAVARVDVDPEDPEVHKLEDFDGIEEEVLKERAHEFGDSHDHFYVTKGDNNPQCDQCNSGRSFITDDDIYGRHVFSVPYLGWLKLSFTRVIG